MRRVCISKDQIFFKDLGGRNLPFLCLQIAYCNSIILGMNESILGKYLSFAGENIDQKTMPYSDFKAATLSSPEGVELPLMVADIPYEDVFTSINSLEQKKISNIVVNNEFTIPVVGRFIVIEKTGQVRIVIHDGHHSSVVNYIRNGKRKFDILVIEKCPFPGNMSLKKLINTAGADLQSL